MSLYDDFHNICFFMKFAMRNKTRKKRLDFLNLVLI